MDPLAHTLFGATLAESGLKRRTRYATATLLIGANLPDVDVVAGLWGGDAELYFRRGWTHGILALLVLPLLLTAGVWLWHRWRPAGQPFRPRAVLVLAFLGVWSHPFLDWLNTYGVRWLMPFDGSWFYGDTLFIIEPWFWLLMAAGVVMARASTWRSITGWVLLAALSTALVLATEIVSAWVKVAWCGGVLLLVFLRWQSGCWHAVRPAALSQLSLDNLESERSHQSRLSADNQIENAGAHSWLSADNVARGGLVVLVAYIGVSYGFARQAERRTAERFYEAEQVQSNPAPGNPFSHRLLVVEPDRYVILAEDGTVHELPRRSPDAVVQAALEDDSIRGFANWLRYADWAVEERTDHWVVKIRDLRYQGPDMTTLRDFGTATVTVPKSAADSD